MKGLPARGLGIPPLPSGSFPMSTAYQAFGGYTHEWFDSSLYCCKEWRRGRIDLENLFWISMKRREEQWGTGMYVYDKWRLQWSIRSWDIFTRVSHDSLLHNSQGISFYQVPATGNPTWLNACDHFRSTKMGTWDSMDKSRSSEGLGNMDTMEESMAWALHGRSSKAWRVGIVEGCVDDEMEEMETEGWLTVQNAVSQKVDLCKQLNSQSFVEQCQQERKMMTFGECMRNPRWEEYPTSWWISKPPK